MPRELLARVVAYLGLSVVLAAALALVHGALGRDLDPAMIGVTVAVALVAVVVFERRSGPRVRSPSSGEPAGRDRSDVPAMRRRLERVEKLAIAGELAASIAHEIKNPLAPIRGYAQMLEGRLHAVDEAERAQFAKGLRIIRTETDRIDARIQELLQLARAEQASADATLELNRVVADAVAVAEGEPGLSDVICRLDPTLDRVKGDADELRGALLNLMKNAAEAMQQTGASTIEVETLRRGARAVVRVLDEGPGVPAEAAPRVFSAFYTTKAGGTGLGLAIARSAVEAAGGSLTLCSREDRRGAVAQIELETVAEDGATSAPKVR